MKYFGTDGIRDKSKNITAKLLCKIAKTICLIKQKPKIAIAYDPRKSGKRIEKQLSTALSLYGADVVRFGMIPTPVLAYLTRINQCDYGIMISASHNPPEYNGLKFFDSNGIKMSENEEVEFEKILSGNRIYYNSRKGIIIKQDNKQKYINDITEKIDYDAKQEKILIDAANGATSIMAREFFEKLGCIVDVVNAKFDGIQINQNCGAVYPDVIKSLAIKGGYKYAFAFDGDGDRCVVVKDGKVLDGDTLLYYFAGYFFDNGMISNVVGTELTNEGLKEKFTNNGISFLRTKVGDKYIAEKLCQTGNGIGGEKSGHIIIPFINPTGDGMAVAGLFLKLDKLGLLDKYGDYTRYYEVSYNVRIDEDQKKRFLEEQKTDNGYYDNLISKTIGRVVVRLSGTEPKIRIMVEDKCENNAKIVALAIKKYLEEKYTI